MKLKILYCTLSFLLITSFAYAFYNAVWKARPFYDGEKEYIVCPYCGNQIEIVYE